MSSLASLTAADELCGTSVSVSSRIPPLLIAVLDVLNIRSAHQCPYAQAWILENHSMSFDSVFSNAYTAVLILLNYFNSVEVLFEFKGEDYLTIKYRIHDRDHVYLR